MTTSETLQKALSTSESATIKNIIGRTIIVEWGTVKEILGDGSIVEVLLSVTDRPENATIVTCTLISPCAKNLAVNITPSVGDKVLVLSPRFFDQDMFDVTEDTEVIVQKNSAGYNKMTCLAILYNQFREDTHKNIVDFTDGKMSIKMAYSEGDNENLLTIDSDEDGAYSFVNKKSEIKVDKDGYLDYKNTDDGKTQLTFTSSGMTIQDKNGCNIISSSTDIQINGKLKVNK